MMAEVQKRWNPFDVPRDIVPPGMIYQWCGNLPASRFQSFLQAGWRQVPYERHADPDWNDLDGYVEYGGMVLMERLLETSQEAREIDQDKACLNAGNGRQVVVATTVNVRLSYDELDAARTCDISGQTWAKRKISLIADEADDTQIHGCSGALCFRRPQPPRPRIVCKYRWLNWLFALISTEETQ